MRRRGQPGGGRDRRGRGSGDAPAHGIRSFVAVLLPEPVRARVDAAAADLRRLPAAVSWVRVENLHLTLRFLGAVDEAVLGRVRESLEEAAQATAPFTVALGGFGGFPTAGAPRVIWVGVEAGADALAGLYARVETALHGRGVSPEGRPFHAHVTLGRVREPRGARTVGEALVGRPGGFGEVAVEAVHLMRSELDPAGARHSVLAQVPLTGSAGSAPRVDSPERGS